MSQAFHTLDSLNVRHFIPVGIVQQEVPLTLWCTSVIIEVFVLIIIINVSLIVQVDKDRFRNGASQSVSIMAFSSNKLKM